MNIHTALIINSPEYRAKIIGPAEPTAKEMLLAILFELLLAAEFAFGVACFVAAIG